MSGTLITIRCIEQPEDAIDLHDDFGALVFTPSLGGCGNGDFAVYMGPDDELRLFTLLHERFHARAKITPDMDAGQIYAALTGD